MTPDEQAWLDVYRHDLVERYPDTIHQAEWQRARQALGAADRVVSFIYNAFELFDPKGTVMVRNRLH